MPTQAQEAADIRRRNRAAIGTYVRTLREMRHKGRRGTGGGGGWTKHRESATPMDGRGEAVLVDDPHNALAGRLLNPIIEHWLRRDHPGAYEAVEEAGAFAGRWEDGASEHDRAMHKQLHRALGLIEGELNRRHPGREITCTPSPQHRRIHNAYQDRDYDRVNEAEARYVVIVKRLEQIVGENPGAPLQTCRLMLSNRLTSEGEPGSVGLIRKAEARVAARRNRGERVDTDPSAA